MKLIEKSNQLFALTMTLTIGIVSVIFVYRTGVLFNIFNSPIMLAIGGGMILADSTVVTIYFPTYRQKARIVLFVGIELGVIIDAAFDFAINHIDRNLFPLELIVWAVIMPIPLIIGQKLGIVISKKR